ncbi:MAG: OadG family protein [Salinivirgaceae bacterium]|nr:OadG family protein [Salinivirgaceae bacterium]
MNEILANIGESGGWTVAIVGYSIVFSALVMMILIFSAIPKLINLKLKFELRKKGKVVETETDEFTVGGDVSAAISLALHMYFNEMHDDESNVITINRIQRRYSPWSSKIYSIYNSPVK